MAESNDFVFGIISGIIVGFLIYWLMTFAPLYHLFIIFLLLILFLIVMYFVVLRQEFIIPFR